MANLSDIKMAKMCGLLKQELSSYNRDTRSQILYNAMNWALSQTQKDATANGVYQWLQEAYQASQNGSRADFIHHYFWNSFGNHWNSVTMRTVVAQILDDNVYSEEESDDEDTDDSEESEEEEEEEEQ